MASNLILSSYYTQKQLNEYNECRFHDEEGTCYSIPSEVEIYYCLSLQRHLTIAGGYLERNFPDQFACANPSTAPIRHININDIHSIDFKVDYTYEDLSDYSIYGSSIYAHPNKCKPYVSEHLVLASSEENVRELSHSERSRLSNSFLVLRHDTLREKIYTNHRYPCHFDLRQKVTICLQMMNEYSREFDFLLKFYED